MQSSKNQPAFPTAQSITSRGCRIQKLSTDPGLPTTQPNPSSVLVFLAPPSGGRCKMPETGRRAKVPGLCGSRSKTSSLSLNTNLPGLPTLSVQTGLRRPQGTQHRTLSSPEGRNGISQCCCQETKHSTTWTSLVQCLWGVPCGRLSFPAMRQRSSPRHQALA